MSGGTRMKGFWRRFTAVVEIEGVVGGIGCKEDEAWSFFDTISSLEESDCWNVAIKLLTSRISKIKLFSSRVRGS